MKKLVIAAACFAAMNAFASQTNNGCQGNCPDTGGTTTNNIQGGAGGTGYGGAGGNGFGGIGIGMGGSGGSGGQGGQGGTGGNAVATGGTGGSVVGSGNSSNRNDLSQGQLQGQLQGQQQGQKQSSNNRNDNSNSSNNSSRNTSTSYGSVATTAQSLTVQGDVTTYQAAKIPVATAYAPNIAPTAVCMGSTTAGGQGMSFGVSFGTSWTDSNCMLLEQVRTVSVVLGQKDVAAEMMMAVPAYAEAVNRLKGKVAPAVHAEMGAGIERLPRVEYQDPIIRSRLGLPPLAVK